MPASRLHPLPALLASALAAAATFPVFGSGVPVLDPDAPSAPQESLTDVEAYFIALQASTNIVFPNSRIILDAKRTDGRTIVTISCSHPSRREPFAVEGKALSVVEIDDESKTVLSGPEPPKGARALPWYEKYPVWETEPVVPIPDREAFRLASAALNNLGIPQPRVSATAVHSNGLTTVEVESEWEGKTNRLGRFVIDDAKRIILPDPELSDALDHGGPLSDAKAVCIALERLHSPPFRKFENDVLRKPGTAIVCLYRKSDDADRVPLAAIHVDEKTRSVLPEKDPPRLSNEEAVRLAKAACRGRTPAPGCPFLVDHVAGVTLVGFPRLLPYGGDLIFDPVLWFLDETGEVLTGIEEPD